MLSTGFGRVEKDKITPSYQHEDYMFPETHKKKKLKWLSEHSEEESLNSILEFLNNEDEKEKFLSQMQNILNSMNENSLPVVAAYLLNRSGKNDELSVSFRDPQWFEKGVAAQKIPIRKKNSKINQNDCVAAILATKKYFTWTPDVIDNVAFNTLYELQYCLLHMNYLNTLCGSPFMTTKYHETFNGTFIYKLLKDMDGGDEKEFIAELFKTAPSVLTFVNKLISTYEKLLKGPD
ncbi:unnamed protein product [Arctia plantaginis]|uniref:Uncharacterized protein n=1 Tax=Arctia plantaginis TaxID=874455 RepID=A0A8S1ACW5_ARCPL|nr:unnamed protein product [Arctia plantaginis]